MSDGRRKVGSPSGTQAVDRAARLIIEVVHSPDAVTFTELAAATGLAKSTTSRLLLALERNGLVRRDEAGRFRPGEVFVRFAWRGGAEAGLTDVAQPYLNRLGEATGETVNLGVERDGMVEQIAQVDSVYLIGATNWLGRPVPLHCAALGKVLLAYGTAKPPPGRLERRTPKTITSRSALDADLAAVRRRGYAVIDGELEPGLVAVAAPVYRDGGVVVAALSVSGPATRLTADRVADVASRCMAEAGALSAALGHRPQGAAPEGPAPHSPAPDSSAAESSAAKDPASGGQAPGGQPPGGPAHSGRNGARPTPLAAQRRSGLEGLPRARREGSPQPKKEGAA